MTPKDPAQDPPQDPPRRPWAGPGRAQEPSRTPPSPRDSRRTHPGTPQTGKFRPILGLHLGRLGLPSWQESGVNLVLTRGLLGLATCRVCPRLGRIPGRSPEGAYPSPLLAWIRSSLRARLLGWAPTPAGPPPAEPPLGAPYSLPVRTWAPRSFPAGSTGPRRAHPREPDSSGPAISSDPSGTLGPAVKGEGPEAWPAGRLGLTTIIH